MPEGVLQHRLDLDAFRRGHRLASRQLGALHREDLKRVQGQRSRRLDNRDVGEHDRSLPVAPGGGVNHSGSERIPPHDLEHEGARLL